MVIEQDGLSAAPPASLTGATGWYKNTFKDGQRQNHGLREMSWQNTGTLRAVQVGDRFYVSKIDTKDLQLRSVWFPVTRLTAGIIMPVSRFKLHKGYQSSLAFPDLQQTISQVFTIEEENQGGQQGGQRASQVTGQPAPTEPATPPTTLAPIEPPPPPPADAPSAAENIRIGQTAEEVKSAMGHPERVFKVGSKEIYSYTNLKVTFLDGKVSDIE